MRPCLGMRWLVLPSPEPCQIVDWGLARKRRRAMRPLPGGCSDAFSFLPSRCLAQRTSWPPCTNTSMTQRCAAAAIYLSHIRSYMRQTNVCMTVCRPHVLTYHMCLRPATAFKPSACFVLLQLVGTSSALCAVSEHLSLLCLQDYIDIEQVAACRTMFVRRCRPLPC